MTATLALTGQTPVPTAARRFAAPVEFRRGPKTETEVAVHIAARTEEPIEHWYWGRCVHDLDGVQIHKPRLALDYRHDDKEILGYVDRFEHRDGALWADGKVMLSNPRGREVYDQHAAGVPYEASIAFDPDSMVLEIVQSGQSAEVNGQTLDGPLLIFRKWNLVGLAICPHGYDKHTVTEFCAANPDARFTPPAEDPPELAEEPADPPPAAEAASDEPPPVPEPVEVPDQAETPPAETPDPAPSAETETPADPPAEDPPADPAAQRATEGAAFVAEFGEQRGPRYFTAGLTVEQARARYTTELAEENAQLRGRLDALRSELGDTEPAAFQDDETLPVQTPSGRDAKRLKNDLPERLARFALGLRFASRN